MGLREGHPEKDGVLVNSSDLVSEVKQRIKRRATIDGIARQAEGLRVVGGTRGDEATEERITKSDKPSGEEESPLPPGDIVSS